MSTTKTRALDLSKSTDRAFVHLLVNTLLVSVINFTVWFAVTFWVFLETKSVLATGMVAGIFLVTTAVSGIWFGSLVDQSPQEDHDADLRARLVGLLRRRLHALSVDVGADIHQSGERDAVGLHRAAMLGVIAGKYPFDCADDAGHRTDSGGSQG